MFSRDDIQKDCRDLLEKMDNDAGIRGEYYVAAALMLVARALISASLTARGKK